MDKPVSAKMRYAEIEGFYRLRYEKFLPIANMILERFGLEVAGTQINDSYFREIEFPVNPSDIDPSRDVFDKKTKSESLKRLLRGRILSYSNSIMEELEEEFGLTTELYDYSNKEVHFLTPVVFIRPKGSSVGFDEITPIEDYYRDEYSPIKQVGRGVEDGEDREESEDSDRLEDVWDKFEMIICSYRDPSGSLETPFSPGSTKLEFYWVLSKAVSWIVNAPLLEARYELGLKSSSSGVSVTPGVGIVLSRNVITVNPLTILALPLSNEVESQSPGLDREVGVTKRDVEKLVMSLRESIYSISSVISNEEARKTFEEGMEGIISEALGLLSFSSEAGVVVFFSNPKMHASSLEELEHRVNQVFTSFRESYELDKSYRTVGGLGVYSMSPMYSIFAEPSSLAKLGFNRTPNPITPSKVNPISSLLSPLQGIAVEESYSTDSRGFVLNTGTSQGKTRVRTGLYTGVNIVPVGYPPLDLSDLEGDESFLEAFSNTFRPDDAVLSDRPLSFMKEYFYPSLAPKFSLHSYLSPLIPAVFYYAYAIALNQAGGLLGGGKIEINVSSSFILKPYRLGEREPDKGFFKTFSRKSLEIISRSLSNVWEGILEERHREYLEAAKDFLSRISPAEDRVSFSAFHTTYRNESSVIFKVLVKYRDDEGFLSSLKELIVQATRLLAETSQGDLELLIIFVY